MTWPNVAEVVVVANDVVVMVVAGTVVVGLSVVVVVVVDPLPSPFPQAATRSAIAASRARRGRTILLWLIGELSAMR